MTDQPTAAMSAGGPERVIGDRYRLEALLGRGGSAEVWRATDEALQRSVALKLVTVSGGEDAHRVGDEARLLAKLSHPGLVPVYDAGTDETGRPWVVMELVDGETLADTIRRGVLPSQRTAEIGARLADALDYVHRQGLVHRDVKPANVLLGSDGRVRLTDFGIARLVDAARVTATGLTVGTAAYLSPEQVTAEPVGPPADIYALGLVLLECLTGRREYPGTAVEGALARLHRQPEVPQGLGHGWYDLLAAMTAREPARRPSAEQVATELHAVAVGGQATTVLATPPRRPAPDRTQVIDRTQLMTSAAPAAAVPVAPRRSAWPVAVALVTVVAVLLLGALFLSQRGPTTVPAPVPVDQSVPAKLRQDLNKLQSQVRQ